jgi:hypothetical protein
MVRVMEKKRPAKAQTGIRASFSRLQMAKISGKRESLSFDGFNFLVFLRGLAWRSHESSLYHKKRAEGIKKAEKR